MFSTVFFGFLGGFLRFSRHISLDFLLMESVHSTTLYNVFFLDL